MSRRGQQTAVGYPVKGGCQSVAYTATSAASTSGVGAYTQRVVLFATTDCHVAFDEAPTATTSDFFLPGAVPVMFTIKGGQKVAAIRSASDGTLYVSEVDAA